MRRAFSFIILFLVVTLLSFTALWQADLVW